MDELEKTVVRLHHWVDHNREHITAYQEAADFLANAGRSDVAELLRRGIGLFEEGNEAFEKALGVMAPDSEREAETGQVTEAPQGRTAGHPHKHGHEQVHGHAHPHGQSHEHGCARTHELHPEHHHEGSYSHEHSHERLPGHSHGHGQGHDRCAERKDV